MGQLIRQRIGSVESTLNRPTVALIAAIPLAIAGALCIITSTRHGVGISGDSISYVQAARHLREGWGLMLLDPSLFGGLTPMKQWPPFFSIVLSAIHLFGADAIDGARWLNAILFGCNILVAAVMIYRYSRSLLASLFGCFLVLMSSRMILAHQMAWTEPLFMFTGFSGLLLLDAFSRQRQRGLLALSAMLIGLAFITRYAGAAFVAAGGLSLLLSGQASLRQRIRDVVLFGVIASVPFGLWVARCQLAVEPTQVVAPTVRVAPRPSISAPPLESANPLAILFECIQEDILPLPSEFNKLVNLYRIHWRLDAYIDQILLVCALAAAVGVGMGSFVGHRRSASQRPVATHRPEAPWLPVIFMATYVGFILLSSLRVRFGPTAYPRYFTITFIPTLTCVMAAACRLYDSSRNRRLTFASFLLVAVAIAIAYLGHGGARLHRGNYGGLAYSASKWKDSVGIQMADRLPDDAVVFTNAPDVVYIHTGREARGLPRRQTLKHGDRIYAPHELWDQVKHRLKSSGGIVIRFNHWDDKTARHTFRYIPSEKELEAQLPLQVMLEWEGGKVYRAAH